MKNLSEEQFRANLANVIAKPISILSGLSKEERRARVLAWAKIEDEIEPCKFCGACLLCGICCKESVEDRNRIAYEKERAIIDARQAVSRERRLARRAERREKQNITCAFIQGCYYYLADNPIWYVYRAKVTAMMEKVI